VGPAPSHLYSAFFPEAGSRFFRFRHQIPKRGRVTCPEHFTWVRLLRLASSLTNGRCDTQTRPVTEAHAAVDHRVGIVGIVGDQEIPVQVGVVDER